MSELQIALRLLIVPAIMLVAVLLFCLVAYIDHRFQVQRYLAIARHWNGCVYDGGFGNELLYVEIPFHGVRARLRLWNGKLPSIELKFPFPDKMLELQIRPANFGDRLVRQMRNDRTDFDSRFVIRCGCGNQACLIESNFELHQVLTDAAWKCRTGNLSGQILNGEAQLVLVDVSTAEIDVHDAIEIFGQVYLVLLKCQRHIGKSHDRAKCTHDSKFR